MKPSKPIKSYDKLICLKANKLIDKWFDSASCVYYDGYIHLIGSADRAVYPTNKHYVLNTFGDIIHSITCPWTANAEIVLSKLNNKIYIVGGTGSQEIWSFDPAISGYTASSWILINASPSIGDRRMSFGGDINGWFYIGGGWGQSSIYKTQNFTDWTFCANLPALIDKLSGCACCVFNNKLWLIGGGANMATNDAVGFYESEVNGYVYTFDPTNNTFNQVYQNQEHFGQLWLDAVSNDKYIYVVKGYIYPSSIASQFPGVTNAVPRNNRGILRSQDGITWTSIDLKYGSNYFSERHRTSVVNINNTPYLMGGFQHNDMWRIV